MGQGDHIGRKTIRDAKNDPSSQNLAIVGDISSELYGDLLRDENFKFCLIFTHFSRFSPFSGYI